MEILIQNIFINATGRLEVKDLINKIPDIEAACKKEVELRLKTITTEFDLKFSKNQVVSLLNVIKSKVLSLIKIVALSLNEKCKYKKTIIKSVKLGYGVRAEPKVK